MENLAAASAALLSLRDRSALRVHIAYVRIVLYSGIWKSECSDGFEKAGKCGEAKLGEAPGIRTELD